MTENDDREALLTPIYLIKMGETEEIGQQLEEWGLIERKGKKIRRFSKMTQKGIKKALQIANLLEDKERG